jgi:hypothetical protein
VYQVYRMERLQIYSMQRIPAQLLEKSPPQAGASAAAGYIARRAHTIWQHSHVVLSQLPTVVLDYIEHVI